MGGGGSRILRTSHTDRRDGEAAAEAEAAEAEAEAEAAEAEAEAAATATRGLPLLSSGRRELKTV